MSQRFLALAPTLAAMTPVALRLAGQPASSANKPAAAPAAKATTSAKGTYIPPKLPWGDPDLEGVWPGNMGVPMQRNANLGERATLTDEEFAAKEAQAQKQAKADS